MVFVPEFAPDAESQWHDLPPILQELVWDEIERLVHAPPPGKEEFIHDFVHEDAESWHYYSSASMSTGLPAASPSLA
jgi:hypothetical protein